MMALTAGTTVNRSPSSGGGPGGAQPRWAGSNAWSLLKILSRSHGGSAPRSSRRQQRLRGAPGSTAGARSWRSSAGGAGSDPSAGDRGRPRREKRRVRVVRRLQQQATEVRRGWWRVSGRGGGGRGKGLGGGLVGAAGGARMCVRRRGRPRRLAGGDVESEEAATQGACRGLGEGRKASGRGHSVHRQGSSGCSDPPPP